MYHQLFLCYASTPTNKLATDFGDRKPTSGNTSQSNIMMCHGVDK